MINDERDLWIRRPVPECDWVLSKVHMAW